ncbi:MAG: DoxX family protein [Chloroflexi bacterium]|nr:DoxX family protein [Chloroflexota bacterium]
MQAFSRLHPGYGIAIVRVMMGVILILAGWQKLGGIERFTGFVSSIGIPAAPVLGPLVIALEVIGGILLIAGLLTRYLAVLYVVQFTVTSLVVQLPNQGWSVARLDFLILAVATMLVVAGAGKLSVDDWLAGRRGARGRTAAYA